MNENEKLRARIAELETQLIKARPRSALELELRRRGLDANRLEDALQLIGAKHEMASPENVKTEAVWRTKGNAKLRTLTEICDEFEQGRSYLFPSAQRTEAMHTAPTYADGRPVPVSEMTDEELAVAAGEAPEPTTPSDRKYTPQELANMSELDRLAYQAGSAPEVERNDSGIDELNEELDRRAEYREETLKAQVEAALEAKKLKWS